jgi:cell division protein FtsW
MARKLKSDRVLFIATIVLVGLGIVMVYSASAVVMMERYQRPYLFLTKQAMWAALGVAVLGVIMRFDYHHYRQPYVIWTCLGLVAFGLIAVLFSAPVGGARRWFALGGLGIQPSELAKLSAIFFIAAMLERRMHRINDAGYALLPIGIVVGVLVLLILLEPDFGTSASLLPLATFLVLGTAYRRQRVLTFLDPWRDPQGGGWQIIQSFYAIGTGGVRGKGVMNGVQKLFYLPEPHTDFIYSVIAEELGLIGATLVLVCFAAITWRGLRVALRAPDSFGAFLALGVTAMIAVQALFNISVALGLLPTKGIPLPFVSFGGSSLLINLLGMGILLNVSQQASSTA